MSKLTTTIKTFGSTIVKGTKTHSPEILTIGGIVGLIGAGVIACYATAKVKDKRRDILENRRDILDSKQIAKGVVEKENTPLKEGETRPNSELIEQAKTYLEYDYKKDIRKTYTKEILLYTKMYAPAIGLAAASIVSILAGHNILKKRAAALAAAYATLERSYAQYRKKVIDTYGKEVDENFRKGIIGREEVEITETDENGNEVTSTEMADIVDDSRDYSILFDATPMFQNSPERNYTRLKALQNYLTDQLHARDSLVLNDVYDQLGLPRTSDGAVVGWSLKDIDNRNVDGYVDFGLDFDDLNMDNWRENIWINFNCDGFIQNLISDN